MVYLAYLTRVTTIGYHSLSGTVIRPLPPFGTSWSTFAPIWAIKRASVFCSLHLVRDSSAIRLYGFASSETDRGKGFGTNVQKERENKIESTPKNFFGGFSEDPDIPESSEPALYNPMGPIGVRSGME